VNDYLAERDQKWMGKVYKGLGLSIGLVKSTSSLVEKQESYASDITYVTNSELVFDFLRDSSAYNLNEVVQRSFDYCVIDEIDSILIDEARTPLILSTFKGNVDVNKLNLAKTLADCLEKVVHFEVDEKISPTILINDAYKSYTQQEFDDFPDWKQEYITKNKPLIQKYKSEFDEWYKKHSIILQKREIYGKLEWQTGPIKPNDSIFNYFIQFRLIFKFSYDFFNSFVPMRLRIHFFIIFTIHKHIFKKSR
jgi:preprotein translocase subunit SecA